MKNAFKAFHSASREELAEIWENEKTVFVFDTNVLLNLYSYAENTRSDFFELLESIKDRLWIPYHVGLEYQRRRLSVIRDEKKVFSAIDSALEKIIQDFDKSTEPLALKKRFPKLHDNTDKLKREIQRAIRVYKKSVSYWNDKQPCVRSHDSIRDTLNLLFENKVGPKPIEQSWLDDLYKEGEKRYSKNIPPGFKDQKKAKDDNENIFYFDGLSYERQFGDLIIWKQIIEKAKDQNISNLVFVTDDSKDDWWYKMDSNGKKTIGPLAQLQAEIYRDSDIDSFYMYSTVDFMNDGKEFKSVEIDETSIDDIKNTNDRHKVSFRIANRAEIEEAFRKYREINDSSISPKTLDKIAALAKNSKILEDLEKFNSISHKNDELMSAMKELNSRARKYQQFNNNDLAKLLGRQPELLDEEDINNDNTSISPDSDENND